MATAEVRATMWQEPSGRWRASARVDPPIEVRAASRVRCERRLRTLLEQRSKAEIVVFVEVAPRLLGVAEVAEILGWDKRRVVTYVDRGRFPEPVEHLAGGRIWRRSDIEDYAAAWRSRRRGRGSRSRE